MSFRMPRLIPIISILHNSRCLTSNQALQLLQSARGKAKDRFNIDIIDDQKQPVTQDQISIILENLGIGKDFGKLLRLDEGKVSKFEDKIETDQNEGEIFVKNPRTEEEFFQLVEKNPMKLQRPIVVDWDKGKAIIARPPEKVNEFLKDLPNIATKTSSIVSQKPLTPTPGANGIVPHTNDFNSLPGNPNPANVTIVKATTIRKYIEPTIEINRQQSDTNKIIFEKSCSVTGILVTIFAIFML
ncbi:hypothetical protein G9A89_008229 [Geosiphon pyriformis]|nr:hypothetical protein G9A89_008229 [Geosiphon pyriformis]